MRRKILVGFSRSGNGHERIGSAVRTAYLQLDPKADVELKESLKRKLYNPSKVYNASIGSLSKPFEKIHTLLNNPEGAALFRATLRLADGKYQQRLLKGYSAVISTHPFFAKSVLWAPDDLKIPYYSVMTNITFHDFEFDQLADLVFVPTQETYKRALLFLPKERVVLSGIPIQPEFKRSKPTPGGPFLVMGGGQGVGMEDYIEVLAEKYPDKRKIVVTGGNKKLKDRLVAKDYPNIDIRGLVLNVAELMRQACIVISKPGPSTMEEAAAIGVPFLALKGIGAQEKNNQLYVEERGFGLACTDPKDLENVIEEILSNYPRFIQPAKLFAKGAHIVAKRIFDDLNRRTTA